MSSDEWWPVIKRGNTNWEWTDCVLRVGTGGMNNVFTNFVLIMFVGPWGISLEMQIWYLENTQELDNRYLDLVSYILESETSNSFGIYKIIDDIIRCSQWELAVRSVLAKVQQWD